MRIEIARQRAYSHRMIAQDEINKMTAQERLELIEQLWDSLSDEAVPLTEAQGQELESRLTTFDQEKARSVTWEEIKADWDAPKR